MEDQKMNRKKVPRKIILGIIFCMLICLIYFVYKSGGIDLIQDFVSDRVSKEQTQNEQIEMVTDVKEEEVYATSHKTTSEEVASVFSDPEETEEI